MRKSHWPVICSGLGPVLWTMLGDHWLKHLSLLPWMVHSDSNVIWLSHSSCAAWPWCCMTCTWIESICSGMLAQSSIPNSSPALSHISFGLTRHHHWILQAYHNCPAVGLHVLQRQQLACPWSGAKNIEECCSGHWTLDASKNLFDSNALMLPWRCPVLHLLVIHLFQDSKMQENMNFSNSSENCYEILPNWVLT